jgi:hypothetical protein
VLHDTACTRICSVQSDVLADVLAAALARTLRTPQHVAHAMIDSLNQQHARFAE